MPEIRVKLARSGYPIVVGSQILKRLPKLCREATPEGRIFVFYDANVFALHHAVVHKHLKSFGCKLVEMVLPSGERTKSRSQLRRVQDYLLAERVSRDDLVLAVGGGVLSDLVGFAAASTLRGIGWGVVPTTLLGMVDAAIGGKTGINHALGKNLIGAFWQPKFVLSDVCFLNTLPQREMISGLGEIAKYGGLIGGAMLKSITAYLATADLYHEERLTDLVTACSHYKARIVAADEREGGRRMLLNLGHTVGHAIETSLGHGRLQHGEAVILGLLAVIELSTLLEPTRGPRLAPYRTMIENFATVLPKRKLSADKIMEAMTVDKKRHGRQLRFVLLDRPGKAFIEQGLARGTVKKAVTRMIKVYREKEF
jgi:3-dehydroquinate synthase